MSNVLIAVPALCILVFALILCSISAFKEKRREIIKRSCITGVSITVFFVLYNLLLSRVTIYQNPVSVFAAIVVTAVCFVGFVLPCALKKERLVRFLKGMSAVCIVSFAAETLVFNFKSITDNTANYRTMLSQMQVDTPETVQINGEAIIFSEAGSIQMTVDAENINAASLEFDGNDSSFMCSASIRDDNFSNTYIKVGEKKISGEYGKCDFSFNTYGTLKAVQISLYDVKSPVILKTLNFSKAIPFRFSEIRFFALFLTLTAICAVCVFELHKAVYDRKKLKHKLVIAFLTALCSASTLFFFDPNTELIEYSDQMGMRGQDPFVQMFDAVHNKRVNIDIEPTPELMALENPYDLSVRSENNVYYEWDRAYYNGKYYSYYGIAPVLTFYYPFYFMTDKLPTMNIASIFFGTLSIIFLFGTIMSFVKRFIKKPNFMLVLLTLTASCFASGIYFTVTLSNMYALPGIAGTCYLMLCLWCGIEACSQEGGKKLVLFAVSGLAFALCLASKPTRALSALILAPLFLEIIFSRSIKLKEKIKSAGSFLIPVAIGCGALMMYNYARFDSPFEFGAVYQLTVSNVNANHLKLSFIPYAIMQYFFQPLNMADKFPYLSLSTVYMSNCESYIYGEGSVGAMTFPLIFAGVCALPFLLHHIRRRKGEKFSYDNTAVKKFTYVLMLALAVLIGWFNYSIAGVILSYVCDILPLLTLLSVFVLLDVQQHTSSVAALSGKTVCVVSLAAIFTVILVIAELITLQDTAIFKRMPNILYNIEEIVCFWN